MNALLVLTVANIRSFLRDRAALFWTIAFPLIFIFLFGAIFSGGGDQNQTLGWVDEDGSPSATSVHDAFAAMESVELASGTRDEVLAKMRSGDLDAVLIAPRGFGAAVEAAAGNAGPPAGLEVYTDPSQGQATGTVYQIVGAVLGQLNLQVAGRGPAIVPRPQTIQTQDLTFISYLVPSILGMALMQLGVFSAIPLVADREKLILKRLSATPLRRWQLVGSNVLMRLLVAIVQTAIIVSAGALVFDVQMSGNLLALGVLVILGSMTFIALGYVIASFAPTEDAANGMTSVVQFPLMFLSGTFFPIDAMPDVLKSVALALPLTYLSDALRQVMVDGTPFAPLWVCFAVLLGFLVVCFTIAARFFRWQ
ncbi:MAG TPA: ABC transporter permease [Candidatus Limnocylindrales bacterium]|jgi:ABC-2 type transport system permease protein